MDVHQGLWPNRDQMDTPDVYLAYARDKVQAFRENFPPGNSPNDRKPFNQGKFNYYTFIDFGSKRYEAEKYFHNYNVSFHNELWSSAFSGKFAAGTTWQWERVFWWPDALNPPPLDPNNSQQTVQLSNVLNESNNIDLNLNFPIPIMNRSVYHQFKPLADLLNLPSWQAYNFFDGNYTANAAFSAGGEIESYYLKDDAAIMAIGWVHNRNAWVMYNYYIANTDTTRNFFGCTAPAGETIMITGFIPDMDYHLTWFPTWMNSTVHPMDTVVTASWAGTVSLDLSTASFGDTISCFLDTLHADYAFILSPNPVYQSMPVAQDTDTLHSSDWNFSLFPNPARDELFVLLPEGPSKAIEILDLSSRQLAKWISMDAGLHRLPIEGLAKGLYAVRVSDGIRSKTRKLIIQ